MATKRKIKRYEEGGDVEASFRALTPEDEATANASDDPIATISALKQAKLDMEEPVAPVRSSRAPIVTPAQIKAAGFTNLTDYLNDKQGLTRRSPAKAMNAGRGGRGGPTAEELDTYSNSKKSAVDRIPRDKSTVPAGESASGSELGRNVQNTMSALAGTRIPAAAAKMANTPAGRALATKGMDEAIYLGKTASQRVMPEAERIAMAAKRIGKNPPRKLSGPKRQLSGPEVASEGRESVTNPMSWMSGPKNARDFKKGGTVNTKPYAGGGSVSSASKRADGCAMRGKTRA